MNTRLSRLSGAALLVVAASFAAPARAEPPRADGPPQVEVTFTADGAGAPYDVAVAGVGQCTTPCALRGAPGPWSLDVTGAAVFQKDIVVPATGASVALGRTVEPRSGGQKTLGIVLMVAGGIAGVAGFVWATAEASSPPPKSQLGLDIAGEVGLVVVGLAAFLYGAYLDGQGAVVAPPDVVVSPRAASARHRVRLVGVGARETATKAFFPTLTFEFE
ncbi:MAG TPA: hypothetical protein VGG39_10995 [Polyangiaceae bacterium]